MLSVSEEEESGQRSSRATAEELERNFIKNNPCSLLIVVGLYVCCSPCDDRRMSTLLLFQPIFVLESYIVILRVQASGPQSMCECSVMKETKARICSQGIATSVSRA
jgi:hypothetical protein